MRKYKITEKDLYNIRLRGMDTFHERKGFGRLSGPDIHLLLMLEGFEKYLKGLGLDLPFEIEIDPRSRNIK